MTKDVLMNGIQTGKIIWHNSVGGPGGGTFDLALFNGQIEYSNGETGTYAGVEIINLADGKDSGHVIVLLEDGSVSNQVVRGEVTFNDGATLFRGIGVWEMVGGTRRFADLRGGGTYKWEVDGDNWRAEFSA
jgi:hypothetical protein